MIKLSSRLTCASAIAACVLFIPLSGCNKASNTGTVASTTIGNEIDDSVVTTRVKTALMSDDYIKSLDIKVETRKSEVVLSGFADNQAQIDRSILVAQGVQGVKSVTNKLTIKEGKQSVGNKIDDSVITAKVKAAMLADPVMKSMEVSVNTRKGEVQLSGFVDSTVQLSHAVDVAKQVEGVVSVVSQMSIKK